MPETSSQKVILLVEDEALIALTQERKLKNHGYSVITGQNGREAIEAVQTNHIDLVLMDIDLGSGKMDGTEAAQIILDEYNIPIVFCTSHTEKEMVEKVKGITRYGYVLKNSGEFVLIEAINMAFELFNANNRVKVNEKKYHTLFQFVPQAIVVSDEETNDILDVNIMAERLYGYTHTELTSMKIWQLSADEETAREVMKSADEFETYMPVYYHKRNDGTEIPVEIRVERHQELNDKRIIISSIRGLTDKRKLEYALQKSEIEKEAILDSITFNLIYVNKDYKILWANKAAALSAGADIDDLIGKPCFQFWGGNGTVCGHCPVRDVFQTKQIHTVEYTTDTGRTWKISGKPVFNAHDELIGAIDIAEDITEQSRAVNIMQENLFDLQTAQKIAMLGNWELDIINDNLYWSEETYNIFECGPEDFAANNAAFWSFIHPDDLDLVRDAYDASLISKTSYEIEHRIVTKKGNTKYVREKCATEFDDAGDPIRSKGIVLDITKTKHSEEVLKKALQEKDFLMKELHHRVKNNLQMISSLIRLKGGDIEGQSVLSDVTRQIDAIRIVHEKLYQSEDITQIDAEEYIEDLLATVFSFSPKPVVIEKKIESETIRTQTAVPLGLIINEIASNAIKHGFTQMEEGQFSVEFKKSTENNHYTLTISNNGPPIPEEVDVDDTATLGLRLVSALVEQLQGTLELTRKPHPVFAIRISADS